MSKLVLVNYRISAAEEREVRRKIELIRRMLTRCAALQQVLQKLEPVAGEKWAEVLARYQRTVDERRWREFTDAYNRLYDELPAVERGLEKALADAKAKRLRLELTAATLMATSGSTAERSRLASITSHAAGLYADRFQNAVAAIEAIVRQRFNTPLDVAEPDVTSDQIALARELLALSAEPVRFADASVAEHQVAAQTGGGTDAARIARLMEQISQVDPELVPIDDLLVRIRELPASSPGQRALLIDSVTLETKERLDLARRQREVQMTIDEGLAWLTPFESEDADHLRERLAAALAAKDLVAAQAAGAEAKTWAEAEGKRQDGQRIRSLLLRELQQLGYEVNVQGAAWDEGSRITIQNPTEPNYDVQLSAVAGGAVQSKVRAYDHLERSAGINRRDVEVEQSWCNDLARVNKALAERGITAEIAHEEGPGACAQVPLPARHSRPLESGRTVERERKA